MINASGKYIISGKKFNCELGLPYLEAFNLTNKYHIIPEPVDPSEITFVLAADSNFYKPARAVIYGIRKYFGNKPRIIFYDLKDAMDDPIIVR